MKTKIIHLEPYDDVISVKDKMEWGNTERILLVYPGELIALNRRLDLKLLLRHSQQLGVQIAIVSKNHEVKYQAKILGIPIFPTIYKAQNGHWRSRTKPKYWQPQYKHLHRYPIINFRDLQKQIHAATMGWIPSTTSRILGFTLGVTAIFSLVIVLLPSASIKLTPQYQYYSLTLGIQAVPGLQSLKLNTASVPVQIISIDVTGKMNAAATGSIESPNLAASGEVTFTNLTTDTLIIQNGLIVRTTGDQPVRFVVMQAGELAAGQGNSITLPVNAMTPGEIGNIPANSLTAMENPLGLKVAVTNQQPMSGGTSSVSPIPTQEDRDKLYQALKRSLENNSLDEVNNLLDPGDILLSKDPLLISVEEQIFTPGLSTLSDYLELSLHLKLDYQIVKHEDLQSLAKAILQPNLPADSLIAIDDPVIENITLPEIQENNTYHWEVRINQKVYPEINTEFVINQSVAMPVGMAAQWMQENLPLEKPPDISLFPAWWSQMPILPIRIGVIVQPPG